MKAVFLRLTETVLAVALALAFLIPGILTGVRYFNISSKASRWLDRAWLGRPTLAGVTVPLEDVSLSWQSLRTGNYQRYITSEFNRTFAGREALIRYTNELWFRMFRKPASVTSTIAVGANDVLFESGYLEEYFLRRVHPEELKPVVQDLRKLQDFCHQTGMAFAVVVSPHKATVYPEDIPPAYPRWYDPRPRVYSVFTELLRQHNVEFVGSAELLAEAKFKHPAAPLFPKGGVHWNRRSGFIAANALQSLLAKQNKPAEPIELAGSTIDTAPEGEEGDLAGLMNMATPWRYPVEKLKIKPSMRAPNEQMTAAIIADSFGWSLAHVLQDSGQFSEIGFFFHYYRWKTVITQNRWEQVREPATPIDFAREVFAADCLILEINEATALGPNHITGFLKDALANLPDPAAPKPKFKAD